MSSNPNQIRALKKDIEEKRRRLSKSCGRQHEKCTAKTKGKCEKTIDYHEALHTGRCFCNACGEEY